MFDKKNITKYNSKYFDSKALVYWVNEKGDVNCSGTVDQFEKIKHTYKKELLIIVSQNAQVSFRKI